MFIELAKTFCIARGWRIDGVFKDIASAINFDARKDFQALLNEIRKVVEDVIS